MRYFTIPKPIAQKWKSLPGNLRGSIFLLIGAFFFISSMTMIKILGQRLHITQILFTRQFIMALIILPLIAPNFRELIKTGQPKLQAARVTLATIAMLAGFTAVIHLPLADVTAISFSKAMFVTLLAIPFLGETIGIRRWGATLVGFVGVMIMLQPGSNGGIDLYYGLLALVSAAAAGAVMIVLRRLTSTDKPVTIVGYQVFFVGLFMAIPAFIFWQTPTLKEWMLILGMGATAYIAQTLNVMAFRDGEASAIIIFDYARLIFATILGILIFTQWPGVHSILGALVIVAASIYTLHRESKKSTKKATATKKWNPLN